MFVQFADSSELVVISIFANRQDEQLFPNQGEVSDDDQRVLVFLNPPPLPVLVDPLKKLALFLQSNPDVADILK